MERFNATEHPIHDLLRRRWSPRAFDSRPVEPQKLRNILEAARWAPSCSNEQPWKFIIATKDDPKEHEKMLSCLVEKNQQWAKNAPVLMLAVAVIRFEKSLKPNRHAFYDLGQAVMSLVVEATSLGLSLHQMAGFSPDKARELYSIPESADPLTAIALGYPGDPQTLPDDFRARELIPSQRKPMKEFVYAHKWGNVSEIVKSS